MKPLHVGLLVVGAALAGGLAVRMSQPPAIQISAPVSSASAESPAAKQASAPTVAPRLDSAPVITAAPPPVYSEPPHVEPPTVKRKPFLEPPPKPAPAAKVVTAKVQPMPIGPAAYREPPPVAAKLPPAPVELPAAEPAPQPTPESKPLENKPRQATLHQGMQVSIRLNQSLSTENVAGGDTFQATLTEPLVADGYIVAERGARVTGRVVNAQKGGHFGGSEIELALATVQTADGQRVAISTEPWAKQGEANIGSALGSLIGLSPGKALNIPTDTLIRFRLAARVTITERPL